MLGVIYGDGYVWKRFSRLKVKDKDFSEEFGKYVAKLIGRQKPYLPHWDKKEKCYIILISNHILCGFFKQPLKVHKSIISTFPVDFLRGFFDSEGSTDYSLNKQKGFTRYVAASNSNLGLLRYVRKLLAQLGIRSSIYLNYKSGEYVGNINGREIIAKKDIILLV